MRNHVNGDLEPGDTFEPDGTVGQAAATSSLLVNRRNCYPCHGTSRSCRSWLPRDMISAPCGPSPEEHLKGTAAPA
jgi:hypothetical protein